MPGSAGQYRYLFIGEGPTVRKARPGTRRRRRAIWSILFTLAAAVPLLAFFWGGPVAIGYSIVVSILLLAWLAINSGWDAFNLYNLPAEVLRAWRSSASLASAAPRALGADRLVAPASVGISSRTERAHLALVTWRRRSRPTAP